MPNHIANKLVVESDKKDEIKRFLDFIKGDNKKEVIDFNTIIPMPNIIKETESSSKTDLSVYYYLYMSGKQDIIPKILRFHSIYKIYDIIKNHKQEELDEYYLNGKKYYNIYLETGSHTWYEWSNNNWGTKWNAYDSNLIHSIENKAIISFHTAWNGVPNLICKLVELFPNLQFEYKFADEDMCHNCGVGDGNAEDGFFFHHCQSNSNEAMETYAECWEEEIDEFIQLPNGCWTKKEWLEDEDEEEEL
jgi:hypothetical protein